MFFFSTPTFATVLYLSILEVQPKTGFSAGLKVSPRLKTVEKQVMKALIASIQTPSQPLSDRSLASTSSMRCG